MRFLRVVGQLAVVLAAVVLTVANSAAPEVRSVTLDQRRVEGDLDCEIDCYRYDDKVCEIRLPPGDYASFKVLAPDGSVVQEIAKGDKKLVVAPASIAIFPKGFVPGAGSYRVEIEPLSGKKTVFEVRVGNEVERRR
jgi:hypothetical protein